MHLAPGLVAAWMGLMGPAQTLNPSVTAIYTGGTGARPRLNRSTCGSSNNVTVDYTYTFLNSGYPIGTPVGVLYWQDAEIPTTNPSTTVSNPYGTTTGTSPVACNEPVAGSILKDDIQLNLSGGQLTLQSQVTISVAELLAKDPNLCTSTTGARKRRAVCLGIRPQSGQNTQARGGDGPDIDTQAPGKPAGIKAQAGDSMIIVDLDPPGDLASGEKDSIQYIVEYRACDEGDAGTSNSSSAAPSSSAAADAGVNDGGTTDAAAPSSSSSGPENLGPCGAFKRTSRQKSPVEVTGLTNGVRYQVRAFAVDDFENEGSVGDSAFGTPAKEYGFLDLYGDEINGVSCVQAAQLPAWGLGLAVVWFIRRRRQRSA